jgi:isopenicillin N synthase-like dioxygenase
MPHAERDRISRLNNTNLRGFEYATDPMPNVSCRVPKTESFTIGPERPPRDGKFFYGPNQWPRKGMVPDLFKSAMIATQNEFITLSKVVLQLIAESLLLDQLAFDTHTWGDDSLSEG